MSWLRTLGFVLTIRCDRTTQLACESCDRKLTLVERLAMRGHELCCASCRRFHRQLTALRQAVRERRPQSELGLPPAARQRIIDALERAQSGESPLEPG